MPASMSNLGIDHPKTQSAMRGANPENFDVYFQGRAMREPIRLIYFHSVAKRTHVVTGRALFSRLILQGCENGERYVTCTHIPDPMIQGSPDQERGGTRPDEHSAWRAAIDALNPSNHTDNPYTGSNNPDFYANRQGTNLICEGFWPSTHEVPPEAEIKRAEQARDKRYQYLTKEATRLAATSTAALNEFLQLWPDTHIAMDALGLEANWHTRNEVKSSCPNCGEPIRQGVAFHSGPFGVCILDPLRAYKAGIIQKEKYEELAALVEPVKRGK